MNHQESRSDILFSNSFLSLLDNLALHYGISASFEDAKDSFSASGIKETSKLAGYLTFCHRDERNITVHLEQEEDPCWQRVRVLITFEKKNEEAAWFNHPEFLEALLLCRIFPETVLPVVPVILPSEEIQWQGLLPFHEEAEETKSMLVSLMEAANAFYEGAAELVRDLGFHKELPMKLRTFAYSCGVAWTFGEWERQKLRHPNASHAMETYSVEGHYYRLIPATESLAGMIAINLGNIRDFVGVENLWSQLLRANALTFLRDHYYVGVDDRQSLLLIALLPPAEDYETKLLITSLLQRAVALRAFINTMTNGLEAARIEEQFKKMKPVEELIFV